jgi:hypothetical protein
LLPAYNAVVLFSFALGGFGAYLLARQVLGPRGSRLPAFAAGVVFTFSPFHVAHLLGHMQVISLEWIPFYALYLVRATQGALAPTRTPAARVPTPETGGVGAAPDGSPLRVSASGGHQLKPIEASTPGLSPRLKAGAPAGLRHDLLMAALFLILLALCDMYYVLYCLIFTGVVLLWGTWRVWRGRSARDNGFPARAGLRGRAYRRGAAEDATTYAMQGTTEVAAAKPVLLGRMLAGMALIWVAFGAVLSPLLARMVGVARQARFMVPDPSQSRILSADLLAFVTPQEFHPLWGAWAREMAKVFTSTVSEHQVFAGFTVLVLAALGLWREKGRKSSGLWLLTLLVFFVLSLGPALHIAGRTALLPGGREIPLPYAWLVRVVPFMEISRSVSRMDVMVMLALGVLAAMGLQWLLSRGRVGHLAGFAATGLILFEFLPAPYPMSPPDTPEWYTALAADPRPGAVMNLPMNWDRPGYLLYQTVHHKPLISAYISRDDPRTLVDRAPVLQNFRHLGPDIIQFDLAGQGRQVLSDLGVGWVVLDRYKMPGGADREYTEAITGDIFDGQPPAYQDERLTVYEVAPPPTTAPYVVLGEGWEPFDKESRSRGFTGSASLVVQAPTAGPARLRIALAPDSPSLDAAQSGTDYVLTLALQPGSNPVVLRAERPDQRVLVTGLVIEP